MDQRKEARPLGIVGILPHNNHKEEVEEYYKEPSRITDHPGMERGYMGTAFVKAAASPSKLNNHRQA